MTRTFGSSVPWVCTRLVPTSRRLYAVDLPVHKTILFFTPQARRAHFHHGSSTPSQQAGRASERPEVPVYDGGAKSADEGRCFGEFHVRLRSVL